MKLGDALSCKAATLFFLGLMLENTAILRRGRPRKAPKEFNPEDPEARAAAVSGCQSASGAADINPGGAKNALRAELVRQLHFRSPPHPSPGLGRRGAAYRLRVGQDPRDRRSSLLQRRCRLLRRPDRPERRRPTDHGR